MRAFLRRIGWLFRRRRLEREMDDELRAHLDLEIADRVERGSDPAEARRLALRDFGGVAATKEDGRAVRGAPRLESASRDVRYAVRSLLKAPAAPAVATVTLALALAGVTTVFAVVWRLILVPLPYPDADRLVVAWEKPVARSRDNVVLVANFEAWRSRLRATTDIAALVPDQQDLQVADPERISGASVSASWFGIVGVAPALGRAFTEAEARDRAAVIVLSDGLWRERFGADPAVIGRPARFGNRSLEVIGVMPRGFESPAFGWLWANQRYWVPFAPDDDNRGWGRVLLVLGRLRPGYTVAQLDGELAAIAGDLARENPRSNEGWTARARPLSLQVTGDLRPVLLAMAVAVAALILAAAANLATLLLARARRRRTELALKLALGASRTRVAGQLAIEGAILGLVATPIGLGLGAVAIGAVARARLELVPRPDQLGLDPLVVAAVAIVALGLTALAGAIAGLAVPDGATRPALATRDGGVGLHATRSLIVVEVAVAVLLTVVAGLGARSFLTFRDARLGFDADGVVGLRISIPAERYPGPASAAFYQAVTTRIGDLPGVTGVGLIDRRPYADAGPSTRVHRAGQAVTAETEPIADIRSVGPGYFETLRIPRLSGTPLVDGAPKEVAINRTLAEELWPGADPIGGRLVMTLGGADSVTVRAVVDDVRLRGPRNPVRGTVYLPLGQRDHHDLDVLVRGRGTVAALAPLIRAEVRAVDPTVAIYQVGALRQDVDAAVATDRVSSWLLSGFALVSLLLAAGGIAALLLVELGRRRRELGVRMALGATAGSIRGTMVRSGAALVVPGLVVGIGAALLVTPAIRAAVPGVKPADPVAFLAGGGLLLLAVVVALIGPIRRATAVDPIEVLRGD